MKEELTLEGKFLDARTLGLSEQHRCALLKTLALLESGVLDHENDYTAGFDMSVWGGRCGTVCCLGGTAEAVSRVRFMDIVAGTVHVPHNTKRQMRALFYPPGWDARGRFTTQQGAKALRGYLETGDAAESWRKARK